MNHIMIDIETMGTEPGCAIISIAAIRFDLDGNIGASLSINNINLKSNISIGLKMEIDSVLWWMRQGESAKKILEQNLDGMSINQALLELSFFIKKVIDEYPTRYRIWAQSPRFDLAILSVAYTACDLNKPWSYKHELDTRTINYLNPDIQRKHVYSGIHHDPYYDGINQIEILCETMGSIQFK